MSKINARGSIKGSISSGSTLQGTISAAASKQNQNGEFGEYTIYEGEYEITPDVTKKQTLYTAKKMLAKDITVHAVPYTETTNTSNGITVHIGKEV